MKKAAGREDEEAHITSRKRVKARSGPAKPQLPAHRPDFLARLHEIYRGKHMKVSGAELLRQERNHR